MRGFNPSSFLLLLLFAPTGCVTREEQQDADFAVKQSHVGQTVADFILATGHSPAEAIPLAPDRRAFIFYGGTVTLGMPSNGFTPAVAASTTCKVTADTEKIGSTSTAADFRITALQASGPCAGFF